MYTNGQQITVDKTMNAFGGETEQGVTYRLIENSVVDPDPYWIRIQELP